MTKDLSTKHGIKHVESIIRCYNHIEGTIQPYGSDEVDLLENTRFQHCCAFNITQIGERVERLSFNLISKYSQTEWKEIAGFRNIPSLNASECMLTSGIIDLIWI